MEQLQVRVIGIAEICWIVIAVTLVLIWLFGVDVL